MKILALLLTPLAALAFQACQGEQYNGNLEGATPADSTLTRTNNSALTELENNRTLWESTGFDNYQYHYEFTFGSSTSGCRETLTVIVKNDEFESTVCGSQSWGVRAFAVEGLFDLAESQFINPELNEFDVSISYHQDLGYPTSIISIAPPGWADADTTVSVSNLVPVE